jgi:hypothetical protein
VATDAGGNSVTSSVVDISVVTNLPPAIHLVNPEDGAVILGPTNIFLAAAAFDPDGTVASVEFFAGDTSLGVVPAPPVVLKTNHFGVFKIKEPFSLTWSNAPEGTYTVTAVATDNEGATATSDPITITVVADLPPFVRLTAPENGSTYLAPANVNLTAQASDLRGTVASVQFFANQTLVGQLPPPTIIFDVVTSQKNVTSPKHEKNPGNTGALYSIIWSNAPAGNYLLTAVAMNDSGMSSTSAPVKIKVFPPPPPKVIITSPWNHATFSNAPVTISAFEWSFAAPVVNVEFYAGTNDLGSTTNTPISSVVWNNPPPGKYKLTAVATDSTSLSVTSAPVTIKILQGGGGVMDLR